MGRAYELWLAESDPESEEDRLVAQVKAEKIRARAAENILKQEREWASRYPAEWTEWVRIAPLVLTGYDFAQDECFGFSQFCAEVGKKPSPSHHISRKDRTFPFQSGNLGWRLAKQEKGDYLTYREVVQQFKIQKSSLYRLKDQNLVEWSRPPGSCYLFLRSSLKRLMKENGGTPRARATPPFSPSPKRRRKVASPHGESGFKFLT